MSRRARRMMDELDELVNGPLAPLERHEQVMADLQRRIDRLERVNRWIFPWFIAIEGICLGHTLGRLIERFTT